MGQMATDGMLFGFIKTFKICLFLHSCVTVVNGAC